MKREVPPIIDLDDGEDAGHDFLSKVAKAEAEADALSSKATAKRARHSGNTSGDWSGLAGGSGVPPLPRTPVRFKHGDNACFKCYKFGHRAQDCDGDPIGRGTQSQSSEPQKAFPLNMEKNRGRRFYKCPVKEENGGRGFFERCDNASGAAYMPNISTDSRSGSPIQDLLCPCGAGPCLILTVKTGCYAGHQFYRCPIIERPMCGFFRWCNPPAIAGEVHNSFNYTATKSHGTTSVITCFKCGQGHYCTSASRGTRNSSAPGSCYKCGKAGHLPKDCLS